MIKLILNIVLKALFVAILGASGGVSLILAIDHQQEIRETQAAINEWKRELHNSID